MVRKSVEPASAPGGVGFKPEGLRSLRGGMEGSLALLLPLKPSSFPALLSRCSARHWAFCPRWMGLRPRPGPAPPIDPEPSPNCAPPHTLGLRELWQLGLEGSVKAPSHPLSTHPPFSLP